MPHSLGSPAPLYAREGRDLQKYGAGGERLVAGCIPVRFKPGMEGPAGVEVLLITSRGGKGQVFPKGGWEVDEDLETAALRETVEEAGVRGVLELPMLGTFSFHSHKAERLHTAHQGRCIAHMFVLHTREELPLWPEAGQRTRAWCSLQEACQALRHEWMRDALFCWIQRCGWEHLLLCQQQQPKKNGLAAAAVVPSLAQPQNGHAGAPLLPVVPQQPPPQEAAQQQCLLGLPESAELPAVERVAVKT